MIKNVSIKNFKSIKELNFEAKKVNIFIGEPNSGKSNLLEALALFSEGVVDQSNFKEIIRSNNSGELFFDLKVEKSIEIAVDDITCVIKSTRNRLLGEFTRENDGLKTKFDLQSNNNNVNLLQVPNKVSDIRYYKFKTLSQKYSEEYGYLTPPFGRNLLYVLYSNNEIKKIIRDLYASKNLRLNFRMSESEIEVAKDIDGDLISFSINSTSDTLQRLLFYYSAILSNQNSSLIFDEPEANTFPYYTNELAEKIAFDETNQFFISTHNPYLLGTLVKKTNMNDIAVHIVRMKSYETSLTTLIGNELSSILDLGSGIFFNLEDFYSEEVKA